MSDPIELTREERNAAVEQMRLCGSRDYGYGYGTALDDIIAAINQVRVGEPVGTIRRSSDGCIAVRCEAAEGIPFWRITRPNGDTRSDYRGTASALTGAWPVIHSPEAS